MDDRSDKKADKFLQPSEVQMLEAQKPFRLKTGVKAGKVTVPDLK
jgi:hypothetical protein